MLVLTSLRMLLVLGKGGAMALLMKLIASFIGSVPKCQMKNLLG